MAFALAPSLASTNGSFAPIVGRDPASARVQPTPVPIGGGDDEIVVRSTPRAEHDPNRSLRAPTNPIGTNPPRVSMPQASDPGSERSSGPVSDDGSWPSPTEPASATPSSEPTAPDRPRPEPTRPEPAPTTAPTSQAPTVPPKQPTTAPPTTAPPTTAPTKPEVPLAGTPVISPATGSQICNDSDTYTVSFSATNATRYSVQVDGKEQRTNDTSVTLACPNPQAQDLYVAVTVAGLNDNPQGGPYATVRLIVKAPMGGGPTESPSAPPSIASPPATPQDGASPSMTPQDAPNSSETPEASPTP